MIILSKALWEILGERLHLSCHYSIYFAIYSSGLLRALKFGYGAADLDVWINALCSTAGSISKGQSITTLTILL